MKNGENTKKILKEVITLMMTPTNEKAESTMRMILDQAGMYEVKMLKNFIHCRAFLVFSLLSSLFSSGSLVGNPYMAQILQNHIIIKFIILLMGKGKIIITHQQPEPEPQIHDEVQAAKKKNKNKKKKHIQKQEKKTKQPAISMLEKIIDDEEQAYNAEEQIEAEEQQNCQQVGKPVRTVLAEKIKMKHLAICFPDSILEIPQTSALRSYFISQVARISSIFKVDQIVILKDHGYNAKSQNFNPSEYIARNLQYLETPQYLRKHLFKMHPDLKNAGLMNPIECHHHLKADDVSEFREGVSLDRPTKQGAGSWVDIGLKQQARMNCMVPPNTRVTLRITNYEDPFASFYEAEAISKKVPREEKNLYWGYDVRIANSFKDMLKGDYDIKVICNHHEIIKELDNIENFDSLDLEDKSMLIFFSGTDDLNKLVARDEGAVLKADQILKKFHYSLAFQNFGVMKLRMQEQLFMGLSKLSQLIG